MAAPKYAVMVGGANVGKPYPPADGKVVITPSASAPARGRCTDSGFGTGEVGCRTICPGRTEAGSGSARRNTHTRGVGRPVATSAASAPTDTRARSSRKFHCDPHNRNRPPVPAPYRFGTRRCAGR